MPEPGIAGDRFLSGPEKAAALLLMLGPPAAARLLKLLDPPDLRVVARAAAGLGPVAPSTLAGLVDEFASTSRPGRTCSATPARRASCSPRRCRRARSTP